jgi:hypothetical protein
MVRDKNVIKEEVNVYSWKRGAARCAKVPAEVFGAVLDKVGKRNTAAQVVEAATSVDSPIHGMFEWDDALAGHEYRLEQARLYIRSISYRVEVRYVRQKQSEADHKTVEVSKTKAIASTTLPFRVHVNTRKEGSVYVAQEVLRTDKDAHDSALQECVRAMLSFRRKYQMLAEMAEVWKAFDSVCEKYLQAS